MSNTLQIAQTFTVGDQTFSTHAEAEAFIAQQQQRLKKIQEALETLEQRGVDVAISAPSRWTSIEAAACFNESPFTVLLIAAIALQGRDAEALGVPAGLAADLNELMEAELPNWYGS